MNYKEMIKGLKESPYEYYYSYGYIRALYDEDLITRNQWNYLLRIINKYGSK